MIRVKFWGVRGSIASPLIGNDVQTKVAYALGKYHQKREHDPFLTPEDFLQSLSFSDRSTYGGNTSCVEVLVDDDEQIVLDMGTGLRNLGNSLFKKMFEKKGLRTMFVLSHLHWDHFQGLPFFGPLYVNKETGIRNSWRIYGGTNWIETAEVVLRGQMDAPQFPVSWNEIGTITHEIVHDTLYDMKRFQVGPALLQVRKLNHPQETYGTRIERDGKVIVYTTDNEPFDPTCPDPRLLALAKGADVWITDCQYSKEVYEGRNTIPRHGWGHSYPEAVAQTAVLAGVRKIVLFHHDPVSSDAQIDLMVQACQQLVQSGQEVIAAYEGLVLEV